MLLSRLCDLPFCFEILNGSNFKIRLSVGRHVDLVLDGGGPKRGRLQAPKVSNFQVIERLAARLPLSFYLFELVQRYPVAPETERNCESSQRPPRRSETRTGSETPGRRCPR